MVKLRCRLQKNLELMYQRSTGIQGGIVQPKVKEPYIHGRQLELLKQLLRDGYVYTSNNRNPLRGLQKHFPMIKRAQFKNRSIYYLEDKKIFSITRDDKTKFFDDFLHLDVSGF